MFVFCVFLFWSCCCFMLLRWCCRRYWPALLLVLLVLMVAGAADAAGPLAVGGSAMVPMRKVYWESYFLDWMSRCAQCIVHFSYFSWTFLKCPCPWGALTLPELLWLSRSARRSFSTESTIYIYPEQLLTDLLRYYILLAFLHFLTSVSPFGPSERSVSHFAPLRSGEAPTLQKNERFVRATEKQQATAFVWRFVWRCKVRCFFRS